MVNRKIEEGSTWITRNGKKARVLKITDPNPQYPIIGIVENEEVTWTIDGKVFFTGAESGLDLIVLVIDPHTEKDSLDYFRFILGGKDRCDK